jgi:hypothetical protein
LFIKVLNHLVFALSKEKQKASLLISDNKASLINIWCTNFLHMFQKHCSLHFIKNIFNKLYYHLLHQPTNNKLRVLLVFLIAFLYNTVYLTDLLKKSDNIKTRFLKQYMFL